MLLGAGSVFDVGRGHDRSIRQQLNARVATIGHTLSVIVQQLDAILSSVAALDVIVAADPSDKMSARATAWCHVAKCDDEPSVVGLNSHMPISAESPRSLGGLRPCRALVA